MRDFEEQGFLSVVSFHVYNVVNKIWRWLFGRRRGVYYIGSSGVLPPPLTREEEADIVARLPYDEEARQLLIEHNLRLVVYIAKRFENTGAGVEDLVSIGSIGLIKAINTFRSDKNIKLATYASRCIENEILMYLRKHSGVRAEISIDEPLVQITTLASPIHWAGSQLRLQLCPPDIGDRQRGCVQRCVLGRDGFPRWQVASCLPCLYAR